jgi:hypothetical protein
MIMRVFVITVLLLGGFSSLFSQTTEEEFLYTALGYKEQLLKGLDDKSGYRWESICGYTFPNESGKLIWKKSAISSFEFEGLYRSGENAPCSIVAIFKEDAEARKRDGLFICLPDPASGQEIIAKAHKYFLEEAELSDKELEEYTFALGKLALTLAQEQQE